METSSKTSIRTSRITCEIETTKITVIVVIKLSEVNNRIMWRRIGPQHPPKLFGSCTIKDMNKNAKEITTKQKNGGKKENLKKIHTWSS